MWLIRVLSRRSPSPFSFHFILKVLTILMVLSAYALAQREQLPFLEARRDTAFTQLDLARMYFDQEARDSADRSVVHMSDQKVGDSGFVSLLDVGAPVKAVQQYSHGLQCLKEQNSKEAIRFLQKAIHIYPDFVSAHNALGAAYLDLHQDDSAKPEFETAARLDDHFPLSFVNLGMMALWSNDFSQAASNLEKAASLSPDNPAVLSALAFAQNGNHEYADTLRTVSRLHRLGDSGNSNAHYVAASAAQSLHDYDAMQRELNTFLAEDPVNALAPVARKYLAALTGPKAHESQSPDPATIFEHSAANISEVLTFPNSEHLRAQLESVHDSPDTESCEGCSASIPVAAANREPETASTYATWNKVFTIHQAVDETAVFFAVSEHGRMINDLSLSNIQIRDDNKPPDRILQFIPQSKLPLRLGLMIDTSGSVEHRISFEKKAAQKFLEKMLNRESDLAFVAGFSSSVAISQDFTNDLGALANGINNLPRIGDGTAVFDSLYYACWKLATYPDSGRVAKVLVVLTDGEDNASLKSLQQSIDEAEASGVTIYAINTSDNIGFPTDANKILKTLAERTGGESIAPSSMRELDRYLTELPDVIRSRYLVAYKPADFTPNGKYRTIHLAAEKDGRHLRVHARKGYYARVAVDQKLAFANQSGGK